MNPAATGPVAGAAILPAASFSPAPLTAPSGDELTSLSLEDLMSVQVTSVSKTKERLGDAAAAVTVITQDDIQRSGLDEIPEILRLSPGLFVQQGNQFTGWSVSSRGFGQLFSDKLLVLEDGRTLYTPLFSGVYWNTVDYPIADLDRLEVIRGPGATLWGANAVDGVINITTKSARDTQGLLVDSRVGTDTTDLTFRYGGKIDDETYFRIYGKGRVFDDFQYAPNPDGEVSQSQDASTGFRIDRYCSDRDTLTLQGSGLDQSDSNQLVTGHIVPTYHHDYRSGEDLLARWTHVDSDKSDFSVQAYFDRVDLRDPYSTFRGNTFDIDFQRHFQPAANQQVIYGLGARLLTDDVGTTALSHPVVDPASRDSYLLSAFAQDTITFVPDRLRLIIGSKFEQNSFTGFDIQPSGRLVWTPSETASFWGAISRAVRTPSRLEWDDSTQIVVPIGHGKFGQLDKTSDKPANETDLSYEIGYRQQFSKTFSTDVTAFANHYDNLIGLQGQGTFVVPSADPPVEIRQAYTNGQSAETYGLEFGANWQAAQNWRLAGSYSLLIANVHDEIPGMTPSAAAVATSFPRDMFQMHSYYDITRNLQFNSSLYYVERTGSGNVLGPVGPPVPSYVRVDFGVTWHPFPDLQLAAGIQNAFEHHHLEASYNATSSAEVDRALYVQATWRY